MDLARGIGDENTILREGGVADDAVQPNLAAGGCRHSELRTKKRPTCGAVPFLDDQLTLRLILKGERHGPPLFNLNRLALSVDDVAWRSCDLSYDHALARGQSLDPDLAVFIGAVDAVAVADQGAIRVGDLEFRIRQCDRGIDRTNLPDEQDTIRHILKPDGDDTLLTAVSQIDGLGALDDAVAIRWIDFFQNIGARGETGPDGGAVFPGHFLTDDGTACSAGAAKEPQLEGGSGQGFAGDAVVFLHDDGIERHIFKLHRLALAAMEDDCLLGGLPELESRGGRHLLDGELAGVQSLALLVELDLAIGIGEDLPKIVALRCVCRLAGGGVGHMETRPLHRSTGDGVHLVDGQLRGFVVFKDQLFLIPCIQGDGLLPVRVLVRQIIRGRDRQLCDPEGAGSHSQGDGAILPGGHGV